MNGLGAWLAGPHGEWSNDVESAGGRGGGAEESEDGKESNVSFLQGHTFSLMDKDKLF